MIWAGKICTARETPNCVWCVCVCGCVGVCERARDTERTARAERLNGRLWLWYGCDMPAARLARAHRASIRRSFPAHIYCRPSSARPPRDHPKAECGEACVSACNWYARCITLVLSSSLSLGTLSRWLRLPFGYGVATGREGAVRYTDWRACV